LENTSPDPLEIVVRTSPLQYLNLVVTDGDGNILSDSFYGDLISPLEEPYTLRLEPGQRYTRPVSLMGNVPEERQRPGRYTGRAVYEYEWLRAVSDPFPVEVPERR
jgi:hypothetical protein